MSFSNPLSLSDLSVLPPVDTSYLNPEAVALLESLPDDAELATAATGLRPPGDIQSPPPRSLSHGRCFAKCSLGQQLGTALSVTLLVANVFLKVFDEELASYASGASGSDRENFRVKMDCLADVSIGISIAMLDRFALPTDAVRIVHEKVKSWSAEIFVIATEAYINATYTKLSEDDPFYKGLFQQLYFTPILALGGATAADDVVELFTLNEKDIKRPPLQKNPIPMLEGDSKSTIRTLVNQGIIGVMGAVVGGTTLGLRIGLGQKFPSSMLTDVLEDFGIMACTSAIGVTVSHVAISLLEKWNTDWRAEQSSHEGQNIPPPRRLTLLNKAVSMFQLFYPQGIAFSMTNNPIGFGFAGFFWGAGSDLSRKLFQYTQRVQPLPPEDTSIWGRVVNGVKSLWNKKKVEISQSPVRAIAGLTVNVALNALWLSAILGWTTWGLVDGGNARTRGAVCALAGSLIGSQLLTLFSRFVYRPSSRAFENSFYYNIINSFPEVLLYLYLQSKFIASDAEFNAASSAGYAAAIAQWIAYGGGVGKILGMLIGENDPLFTPMLARALYWFVLKNRFLLKIE